MSVSVTVHDVDQPIVPNPLDDLESVRKIANEKLRIRRLVQVRQQSKQLAAKVRQNYQQAREKELAKIEQTKREEVKAWKRQHIRTLQDEYARSAGEVGEAHRAAEAAEECAVWFEEKRATQQAVALQRGKTAEANAARERDRKEAEREAKLRKKQYVPSKSIAVQTASIPVVEVPVVVVDTRKDAPAIPGDDDTSTEPTPSPYELFRSSRHRKSLHTQLPETNLSESEDEHYCPGTTRVHIGKENVPLVGHEYSATNFTSPSDFRPKEVVSPPTMINKPQRLQPFTQITELIQQRRRQRQHSLHDETRQPSGAYRDTYGTQKTVQFDNLSDNTLSFPTSTVLTHDDDRPFSVGMDESPRKVPPRKMVEKPKTLPPAQSSDHQQQEKRRKKAIPPESSTSTASYGGGACSTKVQYYDCNTKYRKEYDQPVGFVQREDHRSNDPTGMEEANRYELLQQELAKARSKPMVDRSKPALEKQQTRKDYEKLSKELDNLTRTENKLKSLAIPTKTVPSEATVKQQAVTRQRKAAEAVESLLRQRALVTCPVVQTQPSTSDLRHPSVRPSVVNVAGTGSGSNSRPETKGNISTDSCASIVLDTFERPAIPLPSEATGGGGLDKIAKLKELLEQINEQRRLLTDELAREKAEQAKKATDRKMDDDDGGTAKRDIERLERMKRRQEELLEQQRLLQKREQEVEELARQLEAKLAMLGKKQQKDTPVDEAPGRKGKKNAKKAPTVQVETKAPKGTVDVDVVQPSSTSSSMSEASKDSNDTIENRTSDVSPAPVKIIITVNEKKQKKKSTQKKKSPVKVMAEKEPEKQVTVEPEPIQPILKPLATRKDVLARKKLIEVSPGSSSTTSTVYRPLPPKIGSLKILQREVPGAASNEPNKQTLPEGTKSSTGRKYPLQKTDDHLKVGIPSGANLNPNLLKYIVRLLGMSRQSIDQLGVSSTSVSTPNESIVNVSSNVVHGRGQPVQVQLGPLAPNEEEVERVNRLRKFIDENYNFLQEIDETLRRSDQSTLGGSDRSVVSAANDGSLMNEPSDEAEVSRVEGIWMETLRRRERAMQKQQRKAPVGNDEKPSKEKSGKKQNKRHPTVDRENQLVQPASQPQPMAPPPPQTSAPAVKEGSLKSILKSPKRDTSSKVAKIITPQGHVEVINLSDREEQEILERYSQLTERCSQRITELSQMINQVREEKRRLVEDSLSSLEQQESTKYMDLPPTISSSVAATAAPPQPSQPVRDPPEVMPSAPAGVPPIGDDPVSEEIDNIFSSKQIGLSKDSGIAMSRPLTASDIRESPSEEGSQGKEPLPFEPFLKDIPKPALAGSTGGQGDIGGGPKLSLRRSTPPVAIARFSPQLPDELPMHELSTIPEVETPAPVGTSKVTDLSTVSVTAGDIVNTAEVLAEARNRLLLNEPSIPEIGYDRFPNYEEYVRSTTTGTGTASFVRMDLEQTAEPVEKSGSLGLDVTEEREPERLTYRKYPGAAPAFDITEEGEASGGNTVNKSDSDASLPDVVAELRKRNIIVKPFDNSLDNSNRSTPLSDTQATPGPVATEQPRQEIARPPRQTGQSRREESTTGQELLSESFRRDLDQAGFWWASSMLKRTQLEQHSSDSSPNSLAGSGEVKIVSPNDETVENAAEGAGKPANLTAFLTRQLMVRSQSDLQSRSSSVSSSSHSTLLRSLLNISRLDNSRELLMHTPTDGKSIQRTSTPVASKSTASGNSFRLAGDGNTDTGVTNRTETGLFSGESRLSSVHWSSSSGNSSDRQEPPPHRLTVPEVRLERQSSTEKSHQ